MHATSAAASSVAATATAACSTSPAACFRAHHSAASVLAHAQAAVSAAASTPPQQLHGMAPSMHMQVAFLGTNYSQTVEIIIVAAAGVALLLILCGCYCLCCSRSRRNKRKRDGDEQPVVDPLTFAQAEQRKAYENEQLQMTQQKQMQAAAAAAANTVPATSGVPAYSTAPPAANTIVNPYANSNSNQLPPPATNPYANSATSVPGGATVASGATTATATGDAVTAVESTTINDPNATFPTDELSSAPSSGTGTGTGQPAVSAAHKSLPYTGVPLPHASRGFAYENEVPFDDDVLEDLPVSEFGVAAPMRKDVHGEEQQRTLGNWTRESN